MSEKSPYKEVGIKASSIWSKAKKRAGKKGIWGRSEGFGHFWESKLKAPSDFVNSRISFQKYSISYRRQVFMAYIEICRLCRQPKFIAQGKPCRGKKNARTKRSN